MSILFLYARAHSCRLYQEKERTKLFDDCDLVNDQLHVDLNKLSSMPNCINSIILDFRSKTGSGQTRVSVPADSSSKEIKNPLTRTDRCSQTSLSVTAELGLYGERANFVIELNPFTEKCRKSTSYQRQAKMERGASDSSGVDLSLRWNEGLWRSCLHSVTLENKNGNYIDLNPKQALEANLVPDVCVISFNFHGDNVFRIPHGLEHYGENEQIIEDCDLFEEQINIAIHKIVNKPSCNEKIKVKIGTTSVSTSEVNRDVVQVKNHFKEQNVCTQLATAVTIKTGWSEFSTKFNLLPRKCFKAEAELEFEEIGKNIFVNLTQGVSHQKQFLETCLTGIKIYSENNTEINFEEVEGYSNRARISNLDRQEDVNLTVEYTLKGNSKITRELFIPHSKTLVQQTDKKEKQESERSGEEKIIILSSAGGGGLLLLLILLTIICIYRIKAKDPKRINYNTDENHTYGTYAIDCDGEYEYNVAEVVDNNELYGDMDGARDGAEIHDNNEYYES